MSGKSCLANLLESLECWTQALDDGYGLDIIYLDYRKAFDTSVPHKRLIEKLKTYGITGSLRKWIESFLTYVQEDESWDQRYILRRDRGHKWSSTGLCVRSTFVRD